MTGHPKATPATPTANPRQRIIGLLLRGDVSWAVSACEYNTPLPSPFPNPLPVPLGDGCNVVSVDHSLSVEFQGFAGARGPFRVMIIFTTRSSCDGMKMKAPMLERKLAAPHPVSAVYVTTRLGMSCK